MGIESVLAIAGMIGVDYDYPELILGSESEFRKKLLEDAGYDFEVIPANIDEKSIRSDQPEALVCALAQAKAAKILSENNLGNAVLLTSDQVIVCNGRILEKPLDNSGNPQPNQVKAHLMRYAIHPAESYTSVYVVNLAKELIYCGYDVAKVWLEKFKQSEIEAIVADEYTYKAAGSLATGIEGSVAARILESKTIKHRGDMTGFIGLPMKLTMKAFGEVQYFQLHH